MIRRFKSASVCLIFDKGTPCGRLCDRFLRLPLEFKIGNAASKRPSPLTALASV